MLWDAVGCCGMLWDAVGCCGIENIAGGIAALCGAQVINTRKGGLPLFELG